MHLQLLSWGNGVQRKECKMGQHKAVHNVFAHSWGQGGELDDDTTKDFSCSVLGLHSE